MRATEKYGHIVLLRLKDGAGSLLPVYIGEFECGALVKEINRKPTVGGMGSNSLHRDGAACLCNLGGSGGSGSMRAAATVPDALAAGHDATAAYQEHCEASRREHKSIVKHQGGNMLQLQLSLALRPCLPGCSCGR